MMASAPRDEALPARSGRLRFEAAVLVLLGLFLFFIGAAREIGDAMRLHLPDGDDLMRLVSLRDHLAGQSWYDMTQYRYMPPGGVTLHWSRLVEVPMVGGILGLTPFLGRELAEKVTVTFWPLALFVVYAGAVGWGAARLFGRRACGFAILVAGQMVVFHDLFGPGRIDHHNVEVTLIALAAIGFGLSHRHPNAASLSGIAAALSLIVVLETLPFVAIIGTAFVVAWIVSGERASQALLSFGASFAATALVGFALFNVPSRWLVPACDTLSMPWLIVSAGESAVAVALALAAGRLATWRSRLAMAGALGLVPVALFAALHPACLHGFYANMPEPYLSQLLAATVEALPFRRFLEVNRSLALQSVPPLFVGALAATIAASAGERSARAMLALLAALLWFGFLGAQVQIRIVYVASALLPLVAGWYLDWLLAAGSATRTLSRRFVSAVGAFLLFGIVWVAIGSAVQVRSSPTSAAAQPAGSCSDPRSLAPLDRLPPGVVLAQADLGPAILLHTHHAIIVAGYHRAPEGVIAGLKAFAGPEGDMREQIEKFHVDYLVLCPSWLSRSGASSFAAQLSGGREVPWLQPLDFGSGPLKVWLVAKN